MDEEKFEDKPLEADYGPTETLNHLLCPTFRRFEREWEIPGPWTPNLSMGAAFSDALKVYFDNLGNKDMAIDKGFKTLEERFEDNDNWSLEALYTLFKRGFEAIHKDTLKTILEQEEVVGTQLRMGRGVLDLLTRNKNTGKLIITDDKTKMKMESRYVGRDLEITNDWQLSDYCARVQKEFQEPAEWIRRHLIVLSPRPKGYLSDPLRISPESLDQWLLNAQRIWRRMRQDDGLPLNKLEMNQLNCTHPRYGTKCRAYDACHTIFRDESKMEKFFTKKPSKDRRP